MTDVPGPVVTCEVWIAAQPESVFPFLIDADRLLRWMASEATVDARPGGQFSYLKGKGHRASGQFLEIEPPTRVLFTWGWENPEIGLPPGSSRVEIVLTPDAGGTHVRLRHFDLPESLYASHTAGWTELLNGLATAARTLHASSGAEPHANG